MSRLLGAHCYAFFLQVSLIRTTFDPQRIRLEDILMHKRDLKRRRMSADWSPRWFNPCLIPRIYWLPERTLHSRSQESKAVKGQQQVLVAMIGG
jgi:hypothetical protein